jgi:hypothetical protein
VETSWLLVRNRRKVTNQYFAVSACGEQAKNYQVCELVIADNFGTTFVVYPFTQ